MIPEKLVLRGQSTKMTSSAGDPGWITLGDGRRAYRDDDGSIRLPLQRADRLVPLGQYFRTKLCDQYRNTSLEEFHTDFDEKLVRAGKFASGYIRKWERIAEEGKGYYLWSKQPGSGKTMLACCILNGLSKEHKLTTQAMNMVDLLKRLKDTFDNEDMSEAAVFNPVIAVDVLLLDDVGAERHSDWADEQLYHIIESRMSAGRPTFFTSNLSVDQLPYHGRVKSRINAITAQIRMPEMDIRAVVARDSQDAFLNQITNEEK